MELTQNNIVLEADIITPSRVVVSDDIIEVLLTGKIITWNNQNNLSMPRYYRCKNEIIEYTDDLRNWKKSNKTLKTFKGEWSNMKWIVLDF